SSGQRPYGYAPDAVTVIEAEAVIIREVYARCLEGASPGEIARELNDRGEVTVSGKPWQPYAVRSVLSSRHVTGIRVFRGEEAGEGDWAPIIDRGTWRKVQERRSYRASAYDRRGWRFYLLRGLVVCKKCGWRMAGCTSKDASYMCAKHTYLGPERCHRRIGAARSEEFVSDAAVDLLTHLDVSGAPSAATALSAGDEAVISADEAELAELKDMWTSRELSTREYRAMRKTVEDRITTLRRKTIVRPTVEVLAGLVGADARTAWDRLADRGEVERLNAVLRFLFAAVIIDEHRAPRGTFDYSRIEIEPNPL
ncbi:MAG: recombinase family protein, partial [Pseudonocardiaceae bacterium]